MVGAVRATATFAVGILRLIGTYRSGYTRAKVSWSGVPWTLTAAAWDRARLSPRHAPITGRTDR